MDMHAKKCWPLLDAIESPQDLRSLPESELGLLAWELREFLIQSVACSGGHFAAGLGVVELSVALHYIFDTPQDRIVWDVGHQTYPHKILTGRRLWLQRIRQRGGPSGFPRRSESIYDTFGVGHAGTSVSAALGMSIGVAQKNENRRVVTVVGDGALTAGMAMEALSHAGDLQADLLVVLNDNQMSISPNVGALVRYLGQLAAQATRLPSFGRVKSHYSIRLKDRLFRTQKTAISRGQTQATLFERLGFSYFGPVDGHDLPALIPALRAAKDTRGPVILHTLTQKGKGYAPAEKDPVKYHSVSPFDPSAGMLSALGKPKRATFTDVFSDWLCDMAVADPLLVGITPAMREGSGLVEFAKRFPSRYFDAAIAEQHAVTLAAGLACEGMKPVCAIYSTFLQRAYDQLIHDVALQNLPVLFAVDRAGIVGPDGATHAGSFDLTYLRCVPNMVIMAPSDEDECRQMLYTGHLHQGPVAVRYPRDVGSGKDAMNAMKTIPIGVAQRRRKGQFAAILVFGTLLRAAMDAAERVDATVVNMRFVKPIDTETIVDIANTHGLIVTVEDNAIAGGAGAAVLECLAAHQLLVPVINLGLPDRFIEHGKRDELLVELGLDGAGIATAIEKFYRVIGRTTMHKPRAVKDNA